MDLQKPNSSINYELTLKPNLSWEIALKKISPGDQKDLKDNYQFIEATNWRHSENPNTLIFKHSLTREHKKIKY